ncbi:MAG TPA: arginine deiminase family protein [Thermoanaerobaculia bacterium]|nr:arginine deiminase family protein [Thermoanaerobaculia bacterium]HQR67803.1 arginine deiminase family protein [Thermoanaerobaculia bacterium]
MTLSVTSETGRLRSVLVHLPGREIDRMVPSMMRELLFDDILFGARAREEHRRFQRLLSLVAEEVLEIRSLLEEVLAEPERRSAVLAELAEELRWSAALVERLAALTAGALAGALVEGLPREDPAISDSIDSLFLLPPVPNWFFQRDPAIVVGDRVVRAAMATPARLREPLLSGAVFAHHPRFARPGGPFWFRESSSAPGSPVSWARMRPTLEGGDVLVLREDLLAIGYSERTEKTTIERLAEALKRGKSPVRRIVVVGIPPARSYMHLDTVFTLVSEGEALCYAPMILAGGAEEADVYEADLTKREITWTAAGDLLSTLRARRMDLAPIPCGGSEPVDQQREQWTDGANAFALAPGVIVGYERNERTAEQLAARGFEIVRDDDLLLGRAELDLGKGRKVAIQLSSTELTRARGGPRCMTMPLVREAS